MGHYKIEHRSQPGRYAKDVDGKDVVYTNKEKIPKGISSDSNWKVVEITAKQEPPKSDKKTDGEPKK